MMDIAYDHIQESTFPEEHSDSQSGNKKPAPQASLNEDLQDAYRAFSSSPWGARIGGFFGSVVKQGGTVYHEAQKELSAVGQDATRGLTDLGQTIIKHTRNLSLNTAALSAASSSASREPGDNAEMTPTAAKDMSLEDTLKDSETVLSRLRGEAAKRLKDLQKAEDAADEALLRFGSNLRDFFKDAIKIAPPTGDEANSQGNTVLFESKDAHGKRVIHTSRFDAQLHVIHTSPESFAKDGTGAEFEAWTKTFDIDKKTADISSDLEKYPELRVTMEKLVPDQVAYTDFWKRYYFLRHGIETAEARRRDLLKGMREDDEIDFG
ncbi:BSD-domain-containing protein [Parathielavia appendiculata]|uniref:BSD-domain-containing protein n=1 Tax=Parathielavia appendiculata TaxID=2587402 RepID=A0AAN6U9M9_9PEZI|nr:BSD-domain-containing protein [Parathielavia appendiculata]